MGVSGNKRVLFLFFLILIGVFRGILWKPSLPQGYFDRPYEVCGTVGNPSGVLEALTVDQKAVSGRLQVLSQGRLPARVGQRLCFKTKIRPIKNFGTPGEFDFERTAAFQKIWGRVFLPPRAVLTFHSEKSFYPIQKARERFLFFLDRYSTGGILAALILGEKKGLSKSLEEDFIRSGLIHLLVVSGQNVSLLLFLFSSVFGFILFRFEKLLLCWNIQKILVWVQGGIIGFFYVFSGGAIPILRASLMAFSFSVSLWYSRPAQGFYSLCWSLVLILHFFPGSLLDPSFQLSFVATAGLLALTAFFPNKNFFWLLIITPGVAFIVTTPLILYHFYRLSLVSLVSNLLGVPYVMFFLLPLSFGVALAFFMYPPLAGVLMVLFEPLAHFFIWGVQGFASFSWSSFYFPSPILFELLIYYGCLIFIFYALFCRRYDRAFKNLVLGLSILSLSVGTSIYLKHKDSHLKVSFLSVGQGDSSFIELPHGKTILVDGGGLWGSFDIGERVVGPYLWKKRIRTIDILILSHSDFDHSGGLAFILKHFKVGQIWLSQWKAPTKTFYAMLSLAEKYKIPCTVLSSQYPSFNIGETRFDLLSPHQSFLNERTNSLSLVFKLTHKNFSILFTGDIEKEVEEILLSHDIHATLLKIPHHGSKTSSSYEFLKKVSPQLAVMSLGVQNRYHFPHEEVLKRYTSLKIPIWRTDEQGTLQIRTDGQTIWRCGVKSLFLTMFKP